MIVDMCDATHLFATVFDALMIEVGRIEIKAIQIGGCSRCACLDEAQNGMPKYFVGSVLLVEQKGVSIKLKMIWKIKYFSLKKKT